MILVRHGQTLFNLIFGATRRDPGIADPTLTAEGRRQAEDAARALIAHEVELILASPYTRALQTAEIIARTVGAPIHVEPDIRERFAYSCDVGSPRSDLAAAWAHCTFDHLDEIWWPETEESEPDFAARCQRFALRMTDDPRWARIAVITHWGVIRTLTGERVQNGCIIRYEPGTGTGEPDGN